MDSHACGFLKRCGGGDENMENQSNQSESTAEETKRRTDEMRCVADKMKDRI